MPEFPVSTKIHLLVGAIKTRLSQLSRHNYFPVLLVICINVLIATFIVTDYGESWDEQFRYRYAAKSLAAYLGDLRELGDEKGPFYVMAAKLGSDLLLKFREDWLPIEGWHFMHFLAFQMGALFLYSICLRLLDKRSSIIILLLFVTQPLLWGHAFINPKDIPFMSFFLGSMALGLKMIDELAPNYSVLPDKADHLGKKQDEFHKLLAWDWRNSNFGLRFFLSGLFLSLIGGLIFLVVWSEDIGKFITITIRWAYETDSSSFLGKIFSSIASQATVVPVESYIQKSLYLYPRGVFLYGIMVLCVGILSVSRLFPTLTNLMFNSAILPNLRKLKANLINPLVWAAGVFLGLTASIRVVGPASGALIAGLLIYRARRKSLPLLIAYLGIAATVLYITWPYLWGSPVDRFIGSFLKASDFPWDGKVFFNGIDYGIGELPRQYLPVLIALQLTESAVFLFVVGLVVTLIYFAYKIVDRALLVVLGAWLFVPIIVVVIQSSTIYDNFRHFLFITPPLFVIAGFGIKHLLSEVRNSKLTILITLLLLAPNIYGLVTLHPYQYVYYNGLTGGVSGAFRKYEMDYWATSYRAATEYINQIAPVGSEIIVWGPHHIVSTYARADLVIKEFRISNPQDSRTANYAIISTRHNKDLSLFTESKIIFQVGRGGGIFTVVKQINPVQTPK